MLGLRRGLKSIRLQLIFVLLMFGMSAQLWASVIGKGDSTEGRTGPPATETPLSTGDISISAVRSPNPVTAGGTITYTVTVNNLGPEASSGAVIDLAVGGASLVTVTPPAGATCFGATCSLGPVLVGVPQTTTYVVSVPPSVPSGNAIPANAYIMSTPIGHVDPNPGNDSVNLITNVVASAEISTVFQDLPDPIARGGILRYTGIALNGGPSDAQDLSLTLPLPPGTGYSSHTATGATCTTPASGANGTVTCTWAGGTAPGVNRTFEVNALVGPTAASLLTATFSAISPTTDPIPANNTNTAVTTVTTRDVSASLTATPNPVTRGNTITYTATMRNNGDDIYQNELLYFGIPTGTTYVSHNDSAYPGGCNFIFNSVQCGAGLGNEIGPGESRSVTIVVRVSEGAGAEIIANASVENVGFPDDVPGNDNAPVVTTVEDTQLFQVTIAGPGPITLSPSESRTLNFTCNFAGSTAFQNYTCGEPSFGEGLTVGQLPCSTPGLDLSVDQVNIGSSATPGSVSGGYRVTHCGRRVGTQAVEALAVAFVDGGQPCGGNNCRSQVGGSVAVTLVSGTRPSISSFLITPDRGPSGTSVTLTWSTANATSCTLREGTGAASTAATSGTQSFTPAGAVGSTVRYTLTCRGAEGLTPAEEFRDFTITALPAPRIDSLSVTPSSGPSGTTAQVQWATSNTTSCTLQEGSGAASTVAASGSRSVVATGAANEQIIYTLRCSGAAGTQAAEQRATFTVNAPANESPVVQFNPASGALQLAGTATGQGGAASATVTAAGSGARGTGTTTVSCTATPSAFTVTPSGSATLGVSNPSVSFTVGCLRAATAVSGTANCATSRSDGSSAPAGSSSYTLSCPAAVNAPPTGTPVTITGPLSDNMSTTFVARDQEGSTMAVAVSRQPAAAQGVLAVLDPTVNNGGAVRVTFTPLPNVSGPVTGVGEITLTDSGGEVGRVSVTLNISARTADSSVGGGTPAAEAAIATSLETSTASLNDPVVSAAVDPTANLCANGLAATGSLNSVCTGITGASQSGDSAVVGQALLALDASERSGAGAAAMDVYRQRTSAIVGRMMEIRSTGGRGMSLAGLTIMDGYSSIPVSMLVGAADAAFGLSAAEQAPDDSLASESNWGFFLTGTYARQDKDASNRDGQARIGYTLDGYNISTGFDYRFNTSAVVGLALNFADSKTEFDGEESSLDSTSQSLTIYGTLIGKSGGYLDAAVSFGSLDFDQDRLLDFTSLGLAEYRNGGSSDGDERAFVLNFGKPWRTVGQFTLTPSIGYSYSTVDINSFTETDQSNAGTGTNVFLLHYDDTSVNSSLANLSLRAERTWNWAERSALVGWQGSLTGYKEFQGDGASIVPTFPLLGDIPFGVIDLDEADTQYFLVDTGLTYASPAGLQLFFSVGAYLGIEDTSRYYVNLGGRYDF